ncbi:hypothetical protein [Rossellomorea marisflavi]|uniref:hypothetical protein n=1 Tax=Rossellomorea marisflavi TaxID=189381 RepID=UPI00351129A8
MLVALSSIVMGCSQSTSSDEKSNKKASAQTEKKNDGKKEEATKDESKKEVDKEDTADVKKFSFKRWIRLQLKGRIPLFVVVAILCVNMQAWVEGGVWDIAARAIFYEFFLTLLSFFACFKPRRLYQL